MHLSDHYVVVEKLEEQKQEGQFETVKVTDDFVYKGRVANVPDIPVHMGNYQIQVGDTVLFAKYSPDSHEIEHDGKKVRFVSVKDLLAIV